MSFFSDSAYNKIDGKGAYWLTCTNWPLLDRLILTKNYLGHYKGKLDNMGAFYLTQTGFKLSRLEIRNMRDYLEINEMSVHGIVLIL